MYLNIYLPKLFNFFLAYKSKYKFKKLVQFSLSFNTQKVIYFNDMKFINMSYIVNK